ncbi:MAG: alkaline phosphatase family protein [Armatimonadota bacterium]|nr:alkaline phosphatase family protein [Armatimonadota bacterium]MDR5696915.1 alkaline phosphatase family protein [Armatimonadota bacterium]
MTRRQVVAVAWTAALLALLFAAGRQAAQLARFSWDQAVGYTSAYLRPLPHGPSTPPMARRVVLVVVDGLREDTSRRLPTLNALRARGADLVAVTGEPSLSYPGWTMILTGAPPEISGVVTNAFTGPIRASNLFSVARAQGMRTALAGSAGWQNLVGPWVTDGHYVPDPEAYADPARSDAQDRAIAEAARALLRSASAPLVVVHFASVDHMGHAFGAASAQYGNAALAADAHLASLLAMVDLDEDVVFITADHGHTDRGGHAGWEPVVKHVPLVVAGRGVRQRASLTVSLADVAPTVAAWLGLPTPTHNTGRVLVEIGNVPWQALAGWARQLQAFNELYLHRVQPGQAAQAGPPPVAADDVAAWHRQLTAQRDAARAAQLRRERLARLPFVLLFAAVPAVLIAVLGRRASWRAGLAGAAVYLALYAVVYFGIRGHTWSLSVINTEDNIGPFFRARVVDAVAVALLAAAVAGWRMRERSWAGAVLASAQALLLSAYVIFVQVLAFYALWDVKFPWYLPDFGWGFKYYLDLLQLAAIGQPITLIGAPAAALVAWAVARKVVGQPPAER